MSSQFTTITTAALLDSLCLAVDAARVAAAGNTRWLNAIDAAFDHILQVESIEYRASDHALLYHSESGQTYTANGRCQCQAFKAGQPCKHRAAARLVANALAVPVAPVVPEPVAAPVAPVLRFSRFASAGKSAQEEIDELFAA